MSQPIYLDYNATTPIDPRVAEAMLPYINEYFGNPSSNHSYGISGNKAVQLARRHVADLLGAATDEIVFTSGGTESNNYAIKGAAFALRRQGNHIITSEIEHPAVLQVCRFLESQDFEVTYLPVDVNGIIKPEDVQSAITERTILITIMHANNEVGTIQPVPEIGVIARKHKILFHSDCAQSLGKIPVNVTDLNVDLLSVAGHKLYAPKGIGALYIRRGVNLEKLMHGADHELNRRAGTENVIEIVGLGKACQLAAQQIDQSEDHQKYLRDRLEKGITGKFTHLRINGHPEYRLPNTSSISFPGLQANAIVSELNDKVAVSAGAACHSDSVDVSFVLQAMRVPIEYAMGTIRFSVGRFTTEEEIDRAVVCINDVVEKMQSAGVQSVPEEDTGDIRLTRYTQGMGCACKLRPQLLEQILKNLPVPEDADILVGTNTSDDAAVYRISEELAIAQTVDFFTPVVDDPFQFGAIAAANALSDIYAMGARPLFALNIVGFPSGRLPVSALEAILQGAQSIAGEAGISIIGGHTIEDNEPKFGMAVSGIVHPQKIIRNSGACPGDVLVLTKPLGTGILATALKRGLLDGDQIQTLTGIMTALNREAANLMQKYEAHSCTDVTGFGLLGHLLEMVRASGCGAELRFGAIPFIDGVHDLAVSGVFPGGSQGNYEFTSSQVTYSAELSEPQKIMLNDAQTSGGLLIAFDPQSAELFLEAARKAGCTAAVAVGRMVQDPDNRIQITV